MFVWVGLEIPVTKNSLLAVLFNPYKDDLIQSVTPGGHDASIDWRGVSNHIKTVRTPHVVTQAEINALEAHIQVTWSTPFADANYTVTWSIEDTISTVDSDYVPGDTHAIVASGFLAVILIGIATVPPAGALLNIHAIAIHD